MGIIDKMNENKNLLKLKEIKKLKERPIDFSDIPELTDSQLQELYPKNWQSRSKDSQITQL